MALLELIPNWKTARDFAAISTLEHEATMLSRNIEHRLSSDVEPHPRRTEISMLRKFFL
jgi:predicted subunit of tRNA(5-methylaminomethyl-2-thiouridylate) methyltransferase